MSKQEVLTSDETHMPSQQEPAPQPGNRQLLQASLGYVIEEPQQPMTTEDTNSSN
jgi:hypothetical protein